MKGIVAIVLSALILVLTIAALATPIYTYKIEAPGVTIKVKSTMWHRCIDDECKAYSSDDMSPYYTCSAAMSRLKAMRAFYILTLIAAVAGIVVGVLERRGRARKIHLIVVGAVLCLLSLVAWAAGAGLYHQKFCDGKIADQPDAKLGASIGLMVFVWLLTIVSMVTAFFVKGREDEVDQAPPSGFSQGAGYKYNAV